MPLTRISKRLPLVVPSVGFGVVRSAALRDRRCHSDAIVSSVRWLLRHPITTFARSNRTARLHSPAHSSPGTLAASLAQQFSEIQGLTAAFDVRDQKLGFKSCNGKIEVDNSRLDAVLSDKPGDHQGRLRSSDRKTAIPRPAAAHRGTLSAPSRCRLSPPNKFRCALALPAHSTNPLTLNYDEGTHEKDDHTNRRD